jgi:hypothetical protein
MIISFPDIYDMLPYVPAPPDEVPGFPVYSVPHTTDSGYGSPIDLDCTPVSVTI